MWTAEEKGIDIGEVHIGNGLGGIGRHLRSGLTNVGDEWRERDLNRADAGAGGLRGALAFIAVTLVATVAHEELLAFRGICG